MATVAVTISAIVFITQQQRFHEHENERQANRGFSGGPRRPDDQIRRQALDVHLQMASFLLVKDGLTGLEAYTQSLPANSPLLTYCFAEKGTTVELLPALTNKKTDFNARHLIPLVLRAAGSSQSETAIFGPYFLAARKTSFSPTSQYATQATPQKFIVAAVWNTHFEEPNFQNRFNGPNGPPNGFRRRPPFGGPFGFLWEFFFAEPSTGIQALRLLVILGTTGLVCYGLVRHLTTPIYQLRAATKRLAAGDLSTRVAPNLGRRHDELGVLGQDFDQMAERLEDLVAAQNRLIADISHELRSPLARVNVALELVRSVAGPEADEDLDRIALETERLNTMIGQLLTLSRLESGEPLSAKTSINLNQLIESIATDADFEARSHDRAVEILQTAECAASGSETLLRSAVENVVRNAVRYTREKSAVEMSLEKADNFALIRVRDYGPGVPEEALPHLFQPFYRITDARERSSGGTGLGLSIADRAVRFHGGSIEASNMRDEKGEIAGLLMEIRLPCTSVIPSEM